MNAIAVAPSLSSTATPVVFHDTVNGTYKFTIPHAVNTQTTYAKFAAETAVIDAKKAADEAYKAATAKAKKETKAANDKSKAKDDELKSAIAKATCQFFDELVVEREFWQDNAFRTSNDQLYGLMQKCYQFYSDLGAGTAQAAGMRDGLNSYIALKGYLFTKATHTLTKIVKCVFGVDRRRVSAYSIALRFALDNKIAVHDLPAFISDNGGVEQMRLAKSPTSMTPKQKAGIAQGAVMESNLAVADSKALGARLNDVGKVGTMVVLLGTWQADGSVVVRAVVESDGVVNAALASYYSANKTAVVDKAAETQAANDADARKAAIADASLAA